MAFNLKNAKISNLIYKKNLIISLNGYPATLLWNIKPIPHINVHNIDDDKNWHPEVCITCILIYMCRLTFFINCLVAARTIIFSVLTYFKF